MGATAAEEVAGLDNVLHRVAMTEEPALEKASRNFILILDYKCRTLALESIPPKRLELALICGRIVRWMLCISRFEAPSKLRSGLFHIFPAGAAPSHSGSHRHIEITA